MGGLGKWTKRSNLVIFPYFFSLCRHKERKDIERSPSRAYGKCYWSNNTANDFIDIGYYFSKCKNDPPIRRNRNLDLFLHHHVSIGLGSRYGSRQPRKRSLGDGFTGLLSLDMDCCNRLRDPSRVCIEKNSQRISSFQ